MQAIRRGILSLGNDPALKVLLEEDKDCIKALNLVSHEIAETSKFTSKYGETQHFDLKDILDNFASFSLEIGKCLKDMGLAYDSYRDKLKEVKKMQDVLNDLEGKAKNAGEKYKKAKSVNKPSDLLEREAEESQAECLKYHAMFEGAKRALFKDAMLLQYQGWYEASQKVYFYS
jgi:Eisosome component PIL1